MEQLIKMLQAILADIENKRTPVIDFHTFLAYLNEHNFEIVHKNIEEVVVENMAILADEECYEDETSHKYHELSEMVIPLIARSASGHYFNFNFNLWQDSSCEIYYGIDSLKLAKKYNVPKKIPLKQVIVHWAEGKRVPVENVSYPTFKQANDIVDLIAADERTSKVGGYCKFKFTVEWEDGKKWTGRLEITREFFGGNYIQKEIENTCNFYTGKRPFFMDEEEYNGILQFEGVTDEKKASYKSVLENYSFTD